MSDLPESFYATPLAERLALIGRLKGENFYADLPDWLGPNIWGRAIAETCREAAERLAMVDEFIESSKRVETEFKMLREELAKLGIKTGDKNVH